MPVELRKRPAPKEPATAPPPTKRGSGAGNTVERLAEKAKAAVTNKATKDDSAPTAAAEAPITAAAEPKPNGTASTGGKIGVGEKIALDGFGGTLQTNDGQDVTLKDLLDKSLAGIVVFTYPKASTPGCTTQACLFRDNYAPITGASLSIYGLSTDSPKANSTFVTKQKLQYPLLCDPNATLTSAIGMKKPGPGKSTTRGVVVIDKQGVVRVWEQAGPAKTLDAVLEYVKTQGMTETGAPAAVAAPPAESAVATEEAAKLADPDTKMDEMPLAKTPTPEEQQAASTAAEVGESAAKLDEGATNGGFLKP
ncbi:thioredoxin peroxidase dot5 [Exophiala xenobiotica]|nr:thioredoxin peroxidase dot5 [Exophiala xenobiotica]KAK5235741.1 thioredoxin peroxidase dot5 [Exophiala xenobiotica]KAK5250472.1 thioredoxin peroxidase dot5 [Exophiala xenobiotica]KAK5262175.1 thioredoxin peroxidase dot5 [Exophiala xenobiotica]KAK5353972.1 thioredoxin peroxidase dot5 [Exophiala xenobiotica]